MLDWILPEIDDKVDISTNKSCYILISIFLS